FLRMALVATSSKIQQEALEVWSEEVRETLASDLRDRGRQACAEIDNLIHASLRHLPAELRACPAAEAFKLFDAHSAQEAQLRASNEELDAVSREIQMSCQNLETLSTTQRRSLFDKLMNNYQEVQHNADEYRTTRGL
ncbi:unnamed protein product, partial [Polarella glacialis]